MKNEQPSANQNLKETAVQQQTGSNNSKLFVIVVISVLLTATTTGSVVYFWQKSENEKEISVLKQKMVSLERQIVEVSPQPQVIIPDSTANWKTYQNEDIIFKYPPLWMEEPILTRGSGFSQEFKDPEGKFSFTFSMTGNYSQMTGKPYTTIDEYINMPYQVEVVIVDGQEGRRPLPRAGSENVNAVVFFSKDSKFIYTQELQTGSTAFENTPFDASETNVEEGKKLFDQILSTFNFTN